MGRMVGSIQLFKSLCPIPSPEPTIPSVQATFSAKPSSLTNGEDGKLYMISDHKINIRKPNPIDFRKYN